GEMARYLAPRADDPRTAHADARRQGVGRPVPPELDLEPVRPQELDSRFGDRLLDQHPHRRTSGTFSRTQSMHAVSASTSPGSTAGNMPTRSWLRPSLR